MTFWGVEIWLHAVFGSAVNDRGLHSWQENEGIFYIRRRIQTGSGAHPSYSVGTGVSFLVGEAAGV